MLKSTPCGPSETSCSGCTPNPSGCRVTVYVSGGSYLVVLVYYNVLGLMIYNASIHVHTWILTLYSRSIHSNTPTYKDTVQVPSAANNTTTNNNSRCLLLYGLLATCLIRNCRAWVQYVDMIYPCDSPSLCCFILQNTYDEV